MEKIKKFKNILVVKEDREEYDDICFSDKFLSNDNNLNLELEEVDYTGKIMLPGFIDVHTHGGNNYDFTTIKSVNEIKEVLKFYHLHGVTALLPTLLTEHDEVIFKQEALISEASKSEPSIIGIHLEGPFVSKEYKGAQLEECLQNPSIEKCKEFIKHSNGLFKYMTIAPELPGSVETIKFLVSKGIRVSMGHSAATFDDCKKAIEAGATNVTHCMNAMKGLHQHFPSITTAAFYFEDLYNELILDGIHVVPEMVEFIRKIKGNEKVVGITDSLSAAGLPDGDYMLGNTPIYVLNHDCKIKGTDVRAGSTLTMDRAFSNVKSFTHIDDVKAAHITSLNAAKMLGIDDLYGSIKEGKYADFVVMNRNYEIEEVYVHGERVYKK